MAHGALGLGKIVQGAAGVHGQGRGAIDDRTAGVQRGGQQRPVSKKQWEAVQGGNPRDGVWTISN